MNDKLIIIGCGGHAKSVADVFLLNNPNSGIVFVDDNARPNETILNFPVLKTYEITEEMVIVAVGDNKKRTTLAKDLKNLSSIISSKAYVGRDVEMGKGIFVAHNAHIGVGSEVGNNVIINTSVSIDHDCIIGENSHIAPNSTLCGKVNVGKNVFVGAGSTIIDNVIICDDVTIGAGAVIIKNIEEPGTYVGCGGYKIK